MTRRKLRRVLAPMRTVHSKAREGKSSETRNTADPRIGSGVQQTRKASRGANHPDGEKP